jgi:4-diphosphocytidyl-2-C-methyl-D-erythritol kinase
LPGPKRDSQDRPSAAAVTLRRIARAKVNLTLHVTGRRPDGYHELDSLVVFAEFGDALAFAPGEGLALEVVGPYAAALAAACGEGADNLVLRAARGLRALCGAAPGARMTLEKRLPVAAGLGGGSADAAAALRGLAALWRLGELPTPDLMALAAELGADVPVCLDGRPCRVGGIGERLSPVAALPPAWLVLVNPGTALATPAVFAARRGPFSTPAGPLPRLADATALAAWLRGGGNDLETPACSLAPEIFEVLAVLRRTPGCLLARMSGSGATCFGLYGDSATARAAAAAVAAERPAWWVRDTPIARDGDSGRDPV